PRASQADGSGHVAEKSRDRRNELRRRLDGRAVGAARDLEIGGALDAAGQLAGQERRRGDVEGADEHWATSNAAPFAVRITGRSVQRFGEAAHADRGPGRPAGA